MGAVRYWTERRSNKKSRQWKCNILYQPMFKHLLKGNEMKSFYSMIGDRQYMIRPDFELWHFKDAVNRPFGNHVHDNYEILYINAGTNIEYSVAGQNFRVAPNDLILINKDVPHHPITKQNSVFDRYLLWIAPDYVKSISSDGISLSDCFEDPLNKKRYVFHLKKNTLDHVKNVLMKFEQCYFGESYGNEILTRLYLTELLILLNRMYMDIDMDDDAVEEEAADNKMIKDLLEYISENLSGDLSLDKLSEQFNTNKYLLLREFKKHVGFTIHHFVQIQRLRKAEELICKNELSLYDICFCCGFGDYSNFFRAFTNHYGIAPGKYLKQAKENL